MSLAIGTALGVAAAAPMAAIVDSGVVNIVIPNTFDGLYVNWVTGSTGATAASVPGWDFNAYNSGTALSFFWNNAIAGTSGGVASTTTGPYLALAPGTGIGSGSTFATLTSTTATTAFKAGGSPVLGFRFYNEGTATTNYGYAILDTTASTGFPLTIRRYFYENTGQPIVVGGTPPALQGTASRKAQGAATFDLPLAP